MVKTNSEVKDWVEKADSDIMAAKKIILIDEYSTAAFLCQQSVEKILKALYIQSFGKLAKVHDLHFLGKAVNAPLDILDICKELTTFYVDTRYPGSYSKFDKEKVTLAIRKAEMVIIWAKKQL